MSVFRAVAVRFPRVFFDVNFARCCTKTDGLDKDHDGKAGLDTTIGTVLDASRKMLR